MLLNLIGKIDIITVVIVIMWIAIIAGVFILLYRPKSRLARSKNIQDIMENSKFAQNRYVRWLNPFYKEKDNRLLVSIEKNKYWLYAITGFSLSFVFFIVIIRAWYALPFTLLIGLASPSFMMYFAKRKHKNNILNAISIYISTTANLSMTYGNPITAYREILKNKYIADPIYSDIERLVLMVESNIPLKEAFKEFERKYGNNAYLKLFHQNLLILVEKGGNQSDALFSISAEYDAMLGSRRRFFEEKNQNKREAYQQAGTALALPVFFLIVLNDYYNIFISSNTGILVLLVVGLAVLLCILLTEREVDQDIFR